MKNFSGVCQAAGAEKPLRAFFIWITNIVTLERWLILVFVILQHYEAIGLLVAAKSIIRFGDKETTKTEYVLAGTLMSIFIAVLAGVLVTIVPA